MNWETLAQVDGNKTTQIFLSNVVCLEMQTQAGPEKATLAAFRRWCRLCSAFIKAGYKVSP